MTDEQINIKIAEACGWGELNVSHMGAVTSAIPPKELYKRDRRATARQRALAFLTTLNL